MDDPWGSPWAAEDTTTLKLDLPAAPPQVHTPQSPYKIASPWGPDDDDAWGGWSGGQGGEGANSPGWGRSPGLRPARSGTVSRQLSPEPWGRLGTLDSMSDAGTDKRSEREVQVAVDSAISLSEQSFTNDTNETQERNPLEPKAPQPSVIESSREVKHETTATQEEARDLESEFVNNDRPESPTGEPSIAVTTLDRPETMRQTSKVQELVHMYDGIAKKRDSPGEPLVAGPRITLVGADGVQEYDGDGQALYPKDAPAPELTRADDLQENGDQGTPSLTEEVQALDARPETPVENTSETQRAVITEGSGAGVVTERVTESAGITEEDHTQSTHAKAPSIPYAWNVAHLDELFPDTPTPSVDPEPVPDVIIDDTFASISERKAWYRMSRFGPMRQHNLGNDDDYVRLDWRAAEVRTQVLRIVRRWMEEDSITGRVVLGRRTGQAGSSMFNWDSSAPQVEIGELLGKKGHGRSVSGASRASKGSIPSPSSAAFAWGGDVGGSEIPTKSSLEGPKRNSWISPPPSLTSPGAPSFGWSSTAPEPVATGKETQAVSGLSPLPEVPSTSGRSPVQVPSPVDVVVANGTALTAPEETSFSDAEDDDEWGEMVTSPTWPAQPGYGSKVTSWEAPDAMVKVQNDPLPARTSTQDAGSDFHQLTSPPVGLSRSKEDTDHPWDIMGKDLPAPTVAQAVPAAEGGDKAAESDFAALWDAPEGISSPPSTPGSVSAQTGTDKERPVLKHEEAALVDHVLAGLPDLSYMLH